MILAYNILLSVISRYAELVKGDQRKRKGSSESENACESERSEDIREKNPNPREASTGVSVPEGRSRFKGKTEDLASMHRRAYGRSSMEAGHSAVKVAWLVLVTVSILVEGEVR
jgi:hypothetical protein